MKEILDLANADQKDAYKQLPVKGDHKMPAVVALKEPSTGQLRGFAPQARPFAATAAVLHYNSVSRVIATMAGR